MNALELEFLFLISFNLLRTADEYAAYADLRIGTSQKVALAEAELAEAAQRLAISYRYASGSSPMSVADGLDDTWYAKVTGTPRLQIKHGDAPAVAPCRP